MTRTPLRRQDAEIADGPDPAEVRGSRRPAPRTRPDPVDYEGLLAATTASERRAIETASKTAAALGSVAAWIERAQEQLAETTRVASRVQGETAAIVHEAVGSLGERIGQVERKVETAAPAGVGDALAAIERIETRLAKTEAAPARGPAEFEEAVRGFESRMADLSRRISAGPRPFGRRPLAPTPDVDSAVAEIRSHQADLDGSGARSGDRAVLPALGTLARSQTAILTTLKADVARLAQRMDETAPAAQSGSAALREEIESLRGSVAGMATRDDVGRLEQGIRSLTADIAELRMSAKQESGDHVLEDLRAQMRRLTESQSAATPSRDLDILSHKLDIVAASSVDPTLIGSLARQVEDVRQLLEGAAAPQALSLLTTHLDGLRSELADLGGRQVDPVEFAALRGAVEELRGALASPLSPSLPGREMAQAVRDVGQPIETMLVALIDKLDRIEERVAGPEALDGLEQQVRALASRIGETPGQDPSLSGLERSMAELLAEVASWRDGSVEAADRAARSAVAQALEAVPSAVEIERHLVELKEHYETAEERTYEGLLSVHATLEDAIRRISRLEQVAPAVLGDVPSAGETDEAQPHAAIDEASLAPTALRTEWPPAPPPPPAAAAPPPEADAPMMPSLPPGEMLLEPGSARPVAGRPGAPAPTPTVDPADIKSSFIAAARRAAQAAAAENAPQKKATRSREGASLFSGLSPVDLARNLRRMIEERRRPLLLSAAALVIAIGTVHIARTVVDGSTAPAPAVVSAGARPAPAAPAAPALQTAAAEPQPGAGSAPAKAPGSAGLERPSVPDPVTTQAISPRPTAGTTEAARPVAPSGPTGADAPRPAPSVASAGATPAPSATAASSAPTTPAPSPAAGVAPPPVRPASEPESPLPPGLKQAAASGDAVALYELASRMTDGRGVPRDTRLAAEMFEKAARKGLAPAQYRIGNIYEKGVGVSRDLEAAKTWYRKAAEGGNARAMHNLAVLSAESSAGKPDFPAALKWFTRAAEHGIRDSQFNLAVLYARGLGTTQDLAKTYLWLAIAASGGDEDAGRKRDEVATRLSAAEIAKLKASAEKWRPLPIETAANEVQLPAKGWPEAPIKRAGRDTKV